MYFLLLVWPAGRSFSPVTSPLVLSVTFAASLSSKTGAAGAGSASLAASSGRASVAESAGGRDSGVKVKAGSGASGGEEGEEQQEEEAQEEQEEQQEEEEEEQQEEAEQEEQKEQEDEEEQEEQQEAQDARKENSALHCTALHCHRAAHLRLLQVLPRHHRLVARLQPWHSTCVLDCTVLNCTALHCSALYCTAPHLAQYTSRAALSSCMAPTSTRPLTRSPLTLAGRAGRPPWPTATSCCSLRTCCRPSTWSVVQLITDRRFSTSVSDLKSQ